MPFDRDKSVVLVALGLSDLQLEQLQSAARQLRIGIHSELPASGDFIVLMGKDQVRPHLPAHIPLVDADGPGLARRLEEALLYLEAHRRIKQ